MITSAINPLALVVNCKRKLIAFKRICVATPLVSNLLRNALPHALRLTGNLNAQILQ
jgi:hypothetical protein